MFHVELFEKHNHRFHVEHSNRKQDGFIPLALFVFLALIQIFNTNFTVIIIPARCKAGLSSLMPACIETLPSLAAYSPSIDTLIYPVYQCRLVR